MHDGAATTGRTRGHHLWLLDGGRTIRQPRTPDRAGSASRPAATRGRALPVPPEG
jgi:hypothetical protein